MGSAAATATAIRTEVAGLLGVGADTLDPENDLIGQGLDSIRMMALAGRWRRLGRAVDFATLAATPRIAAWSELIAAGAPAPRRLSSPAPGRRARNERAQRGRRRNLAAGPRASGVTLRPG